MRSLCLMSLVYLPKKKWWQPLRNGYLPPFHHCLLVPSLFQLLWLHFLSATATIVVPTALAVYVAIYACSWLLFLSSFTTADADNDHPRPPLPQMSSLSSLLSPSSLPLSSLLSMSTVTVIIHRHCHCCHHHPPPPHSCVPLIAITGLIVALCRLPPPSLTRCQTFTRKIKCSNNSNIRGPSNNKFALVVFFTGF